MIAKEAATRPDEVVRYQDTLNNLTDKVSNGEGVSTIPLSEAQAKEIAINAKLGKVTPESIELELSDIIKMEYVMKNAVKVGLESAAIAAGISMVLSLSTKLVNEGKCFWDFDSEDWKDV